MERKRNQEDAKTGSVTEVDPSNPERLPVFRRAGSRKRLGVLSKAFNFNQL
jgi:hypothetical protein